MAVDALLQVLAVGSGASLGREQAPRLFAASFAEGGSGEDAAGAASAHPAGQRRRCRPGRGSCPLRACVRARHRAEELAAAGGARRGRDVEHCYGDGLADRHGKPTFVWPDPEYNWQGLLFALTAMPLGVLVGTVFDWLIDYAKPKTPPNLGR